MLKITFKDLEDVAKSVKKVLKDKSVSDKSKLELEKIIKMLNENYLNIK